MRKKEAFILIVDDDADVLFSAKMWLKRFFTNVVTTTSPKKMQQFFNDNEIDVVLLDMNYRKGFEDGKEGLYWLDYIQDISPETSVVLMTAFGDVNLAVSCIKKGAHDFILKPWNNEKLYASVNAAVDMTRKNKKINQYETLSKQTDKVNFIGQSAAVKSALELADKVGPTDATVLILGENGTGKYVYARELHQRSLRKQDPFVHVDLGALNENLFESELFGYAKGSFTDAKTDKPGRFELANGGTIFLDEIGNLSLALQAKLLSVIQNKTINRLGESKVRHLDVRIFCATNKPIYQAVANNEFRQDLLFRINTIEVQLPPLRERGKDIEILANYFLERFKAKYNKLNLGFTQDAIDELQQYLWPGNIREMEHVIERAVILSENDTITAYNLHFSSMSVNPSFNHSLNLEDMESQLIKRALQKHKGNISKAAKALGLTRAALYRRIEKYNL